MRVLVTGGAGFLGSNAIDALVARGDLVVALDDLSTGVRANLAPDIALRIASIADERALFDAVKGEGFDAIVHCAAKTKVVESMDKVDLYRRVIVDGTRNVVKLAEDRHVQMLVNISTGGALYGETPSCADERSKTEPPSNYGKFKLEAERIVSGAQIPNITLRLANIYGPRQRTDLEGGVVAIFLSLWRAKKPLTIFGDGNDERDYVYVADAVEAMTSAFAGNWTGVYNIGTGIATSVNALVQALSEHLGPPPEIRHAPERAGGVELDRSCLDISKAAREGFWRPKTSLREGLALTVKAA